MKSKNYHLCKSLLAKILVLVMVVTVLGLQPSTALAASSPTLSKTKISIAEGKTFTLKVKDKIFGSTYKWTSNNPSIASVTKKGVVRGNKGGTTTINCKVKAPKETYNLTCDVTVGEGSDSQTTTSTPTQSNIKSIKLDVSVTGVTKETTLTYKSTTDSWTDVTSDLKVSKDGNYSITLSYSDAAGLKNLGYFVTIADSTIKVTVNNITINDSYVLTYSAVAEINSTTANGLANIWNVPEAGTKVAEGSNAYLQLNSDKSLLTFYSAK